MIYSLLLSPPTLVDATIIQDYSSFENCSFVQENIQKQLNNLKKRPGVTVQAMCARKP